jgi:hypothetical protein
MGADVQSPPLNRLVCLAVDFIRAPGHETTIRLDTGIIPHRLRRGSLAVDSHPLLAAAYFAAAGFSARAFQSAPFPRQGASHLLLIEVTCRALGRQPRSLVTSELKWGRHSPS